MDSEVQLLISLRRICEITKVMQIVVIIRWQSIQNDLNFSNGNGR